MFPEDRVLVGVINRVRDLKAARDEHWYRIPQAQMPRGVNAEYVALYVSSRYKRITGGIHYFAEIKGLELAERRILLPDEPHHKRADHVYYRVALGELQSKIPPVLNPTNRPITFIYTTWDRFVHASTIGDLYSEADYYVDRIYHALKDRGLHPQRMWEAESREYTLAPGVRILCENGEVIASTAPSDRSVFMDSAQNQDEILNAILLRIASSGGPVTMGISPMG